MRTDPVLFQGFLDDLLTYMLIAQRPIKIYEFSKNLKFTRLSKGLTKKALEITVHLLFFHGAHQKNVMWVLRGSHFFHWVPLAVFDLKGN